MSEQKNTPGPLKLKDLGVSNTTSVHYPRSGRHERVGLDWMSDYDSTITLRLLHYDWTAIDKEVIFSAC